MDQRARTSVRQRKGRETEREEGAKKKARLRTSQDVYNRIIWDTGRYDPATFIIGYLDRFDGMMEIALNEFVPIDKGGDIAYHRIYYFRSGDQVVWDRNNRIDTIFGSGEPNTNNTNTSTNDHNTDSGSSGEDAEGEQQQQQQDETTTTQVMEVNADEGLPHKRSCGILLFADIPAGSGAQHFLLMKHAKRYDLPKGHVEQEETDRECALREVMEETGFQAEQIEIEPHFAYEETYYPVYRRLGNKRVKKTVRIFLGRLKEDTAVVERDPSSGQPLVRRTEHGGHEWMRWNPPHRVQKNTIDPLLKAVAKHFGKTGELIKEGHHDEEDEAEEVDDEEDEEEDEEKDEEERKEVAEAGTVARSAEKEQLERERQDKASKRSTTRTRRVDYNARKTRRQRNAMVSGGGYALLDKVQDEFGRGGQVGIYHDEEIVFDESALNAQAKLILKRNDKANRRLDDRVHAYTADADSDDDLAIDEEAAQYISSSSKDRVSFDQYLVATSSSSPVTTTEQTDTTNNKEWACSECTYVNKPSFLCCEVCTAERRA